MLQIALQYLVGALVLNDAIENLIGGSKLKLYDQSETDQTEFLDFKNFFT